MEITDFLNKPGVAMGQALLLRYRPLNMDVLPLYIVLMFFLPLILQLIKWRARSRAGRRSVALYTLTWRYDLHLTAYPNGFWSFQPVRVAIAVRVRRLVRNWVEPGESRDFWLPPSRWLGLLCSICSRHSA